jgi:insertion element IS1 protein InsB
LKYQGRPEALRMSPRNAMECVKNKRRKLWIWKALDPDTGQLLDWECGRRDKATLKKMVTRLAQWDVKLYCTDPWAA